MLKNLLEEAARLRGSGEYEGILNRIASRMMIDNPEDPVSELFQAAGEDTKLLAVAEEVTSAALAAANEAAPDDYQHYVINGLPLMAARAR